MTLSRLETSSSRLFAPLALGEGRWLARPRGRPRSPRPTSNEAEAFWTRLTASAPVCPASKGRGGFGAGTVTALAGGPAGMSRLADGNGARVRRAGAFRPLPSAAIGGQVSMYPRGSNGRPWNCFLDRHPGDNWSGRRTAAVTRRPECCRMQRGCGRIQHPARRCEHRHLAPRSLTSIVAVSDPPGKSPGCIDTGCMATADVFAGRSRVPRFLSSANFPLFEGVTLPFTNSPADISRSSLPPLAREAPKVLRWTVVDRAPIPDPALFEATVRRQPQCHR
jgi:hypothetical protein